MHKLQQYIIDQLYSHKFATFSDIKPEGVNSNNFTYHLNKLIKSGAIEKSADGYSLTSYGLVNSFLNQPRIFPKFPYQRQPDVQIMFVIQNSGGDILLEKRRRQPFIDCWTLPQGLAEVNTKSLQEAASHVAFSVLGLENPEVQHAGDCYVRLRNKGLLVVGNFVHVFRLYHDYKIEDDNFTWARPHKLDQYELVPTTEQIMTRTFFKDDYFFEEFSVDF